MLPFLKPKKGMVAGLIIKSRQPDQKPEENQEDNSSAIHDCAADLIDAVHAKDIEAAAKAMESAFKILEKMPHEEADHEPHSYQAQKED